MTADELHAYLDGRPHRLIRRFVITQASGKQRVIDDAAAGGQSDLSADANKLRLCSALQPVQHVGTLFRAIHKDGGHFPTDEGISSGGEDWPDAYRHTPMSHETMRGMGMRCSLLAPAVEGPSLSPLSRTPVRAAARGYIL